MKTMRFLSFLLSVVLLLPLLSSCAEAPQSYVAPEGEAWFMGFASEEIPLPETDDPLYIAGYRQGKEITGVLDLQRANAVWMDTGDAGVLLIGIDCVGLGSDTVNKIREELSDFCRQTNCVSVNVYATHTHAGVDTLGLWGPIAVDGKNDAFMENLIHAAVSAAKGAYADRSQGKLLLGTTVPEDLLYDSRRPQEYDSTLYQLRFVPDHADQNGIRLLSYAAHAESLRGDNTLLSRDFPGAISDGIKAATGDDTLFLPGAIGGLIMTRELVDEPFDATENLRLTGEALTKAVLSIDSETELFPSLSIASEKVEIPLDNTLFLCYRFLGILGNPAVDGDGETGYSLVSELGVLALGNVTLALIPGEIFPELVSGNGLGAEDPEPLSAIARRHGIENLLIVGLCNDELGYIVPPSDYLINPDAPYLDGIEDATGENHYEETNSTGIRTAALLAEAFEEILSLITEPRG